MIARTRVVVAVLSGMVAGAAAIIVAPWQFAVLAGWNVAAAVFLVWVWGTVGGMNGQQTSAYARREDPSRALTDLMLLVASVSCLIGVAFTLVKAAHATGAGKAALVSVAVASVIASWSVVHTVFTLRYARLYYGSPGGGVDFNDDDDPDYIDFAYLAFTVGMTYQVSDTNISNRPLRRTALHHALLSFLFGTFIVAITINVIAGLLK